MGGFLSNVWQAFIFPLKTGTGIQILYDSSSASFFFFSVFRLFFRFVNENFFCLFVESSSHLRWLAVVFPNANRLFSEILLSPPSPPPREKFLNFIGMFIAIVMLHSLFQISIFWSKPEWASFECEGRKLVLSALNIHVAGENLRILYPASLRNLNLN